MNTANNAKSLPQSHAMRASYIQKLLARYKQPSNDTEFRASLITSKHIEFLFSCGFKSLEEIAAAVDTEMGLYDGEEMAWARNNGESFAAELFGEIYRVITSNDMRLIEGSLFLWAVYEVMKRGKSAKSIIIKNGFSSDYFLRAMGKERAEVMRKVFIGSPLSEKFYIISGFSEMEYVRIRVFAAHKKSEYIKAEHTLLN